MLQRKSVRLKNFDYSQAGVYFVTICSKGRVPLFGRVRNSEYESFVELSCIGHVIQEELVGIPSHYSDVLVNVFVVMPNHLHMLLSFESHAPADAAPPVSIPRIIKQLKGSVTKRLGYSVWQKSFYEHVIRTQKEYDATWNYIEMNPSKWALDNYWI